MKKYNTEKVNAKDSNRPELKLMIDFIEEVYSVVIDRLVRSTENLSELILIKQKTIYK